MHDKGLVKGQIQRSTKKGKRKENEAFRGKQKRCKEDEAAVPTKAPCEKEYRIDAHISNLVLVRFFLWIFEEDSEIRHVIITPCEDLG